MVAVSLGLVVGVLVTALVAGGGGNSTSQQGSGGGHQQGSSGGRPEDLVDVRTVTYRSSFDDTDVTGLAAIPRGVASRGCVIWQYGFRSTKEQSHFAWQPLAALGLTTFSIDFRFHGARGSGEDEYTDVLAHPAKFRAMMRGTVGDLRSAIDYLEKQPYCAKNIAYVGVSLGGAVGTILAAGDQRVKAAALVVTPGTWSDVKTVPAGLSAFDPDRYVAKIAPRPVLILSGRTDTTVTIANARRLQAAARGPKTVVDFDGGHDPAAGPDGVDNANKIFSFLLRTVVEPTYGVAGHANGTFLLDR
ncbi:MAG TPA: alpha/beta hydrolase [Baekduia sp.]|nr:alpha/beta hydrolase [Baekduia sp.]